MTKITIGSTLSLFQLSAINLFVEVCKRNGVGQFNSVFEVPNGRPATDYGNAIKINLANHDVTLWLFSESFQIFENENDEYGCTNELVDSRDNFDVFINLFLEKILAAFNFKN